MSTGNPKRKRVDGTGDDHSERNPKQRKKFSKQPQSKQYPNHYSRPAKRGPSPDEEARASINELKNRVRDLNRLLKHADNDPTNRMPQGVRVERERELESCKHELEEKQKLQREAKFRNSIIGKYHMVRFFERKRAERAIKRLNKELEPLTDDSERAAKSTSIHNAEVDLNYALYHPLLKPYVSLYRERERKGDIPDGPKGDVDMWKKVEKAMEDETLEALRESKEGVVIPKKANSYEVWKFREDRKREERNKKGEEGNARKEQASNGHVAVRETEDQADSDDGEDFFFQDTEGDPGLKVRHISRKRA